MKTIDIDEDSFLFALWTDVGALVLMARGMASQLAELRSRDWADPDASRFVNKMNMKALGGAAMLFERTCTELMILGMSRVLENVVGALQNRCGTKVNIYADTSPPLRFHRDVKIIRHLANVIKHNASCIDAANGRSAACLVNEFGLPDQTPIGLAWGFADLRVEPNIVKNLYRVEAFCYDLIARTTSFRDRFVEIPESDIERHMFQKYLAHIPGEGER